MDDILSDPGAYSDGDGSLPEEAPDVTPALEELTPDFTPSLENLIPNTAMGDNANDGTIDLGFGSLSDATDDSSDGLETSLLGVFGGLGTSLLNAFVVNPQNAQTAEQQQLQTAGITSALTSQWFGYLLIGLVIFLIFGAFEKK